VLVCLQPVLVASWLLLRGHANWPKFQILEILSNRFLSNFVREETIAKTYYNVKSKNIMGRVIKIS
jgi:hypothetical protein